MDAGEVLSWAIFFVGPLMVLRFPAYTQNFVFDQISKVLDPVFPAVDERAVDLVAQAYKLVPSLVAVPGYRLHFLAALLGVAGILWLVQLWCRRLMGTDLAVQTDTHSLARAFYRMPFLTAVWGLVLPYTLLYLGETRIVWLPYFDFLIWFVCLPVSLVRVRRWRRRRGPGSAPGLLPYAILAPFAFYLPLQVAGWAAVLPVAIKHNALCRDRAGLVLNAVPEKPIAVFHDRSKAPYQADNNRYDLGNDGMETFLEDRWSRAIAHLEIYTDGIPDSHPAGPEAIDPADFWYIDEPGTYRLSRQSNGHPACKPAPFQRAPQNLKDDDPYPLSLGEESCLAVRKLDQREAPYRYIQRPSAQPTAARGKLKGAIADALPEQSRFNPIDAGAGARTLELYQGLVHDPSGRIVAELRDFRVAYPFIKPEFRDFYVKGPLVENQCAGTRQADGTREAAKRAGLGTGEGLKPHLYDFMRVALDHNPDD